MCCFEVLIFVVSFYCQQLVCSRPKVRTQYVPLVSEIASSAPQMCIHSDPHAIHLKSLLLLCHRPRACFSTLSLAAGVLAASTISWLVGAISATVVTTLISGVVPITWCVPCALSLLSERTGDLESIVGCSVATTKMVGTSAFASQGARIMKAGSSTPDGDFYEEVFS